MCQNKHPRVCVSYFFPLTLHPRRLISAPATEQCWQFRCPCMGGTIMRHEAGGRNSSTRRLGDQGDFQSSSSPESSPSFACGRLGSSGGGPTWIWRSGSHAQGTRHSASKGAPLLAHPPQLPQLDPSLLRLQDCDTSPHIYIYTCMYTYILFEVPFPYRTCQCLVAFPCSTVGPCGLSVVSVLMYTCECHPPNVSLSPFSLLGTISLFCKSVSLLLFCKLVHVYPF